MSKTMLVFGWYTSCVVLLASVVRVNGFTSPLASVRVETRLDAVPPMIIGPMIRKMREENEKKKAPMATDDEARGEAPGLRVGGSAWKWPPVWPYDSESFLPTEDIPKPDPSAQMNPMAGMLGGMPQAPLETPEVEDIETLDEMEYWGTEKANVRTELDEEAVEKLKAHYAYYLKPGLSILEFGAAEESYLPEGFQPSRHVGVGANLKLMEENPSLTEKLVVNLNDVVEERDVDSDDLRKLGADPFDVVLMANTVDFLTHPREVFRSAWNLLKPGGIMVISFSTRKAFGKKFERAQTKVWREFNDDQHMWICGSFFHFSAGDGWENLRGFDISPESAKDSLETGPLSMFKQGKDNNVFVVQASKGYQDEDIDDVDPEKSIKSKMWMMPTMEDRDKQLVAPRLARTYKISKSEEKKKAIADNLYTLPVIYESLIKMDQFSFTFQMQSQLAADLACNPLFTGNDDQVMALKQGLGLRSPSPEFWQPVGENTADMIIEDKINLLAQVVPRFGTGNSEQEAALEAFASGLKPTFSLIRSKCPNLPESDVQLLGTELLYAEVMVPGRSTREDFAAWLGAMTQTEMMDLLASRKSFTDKSQEELKTYKEKKAAEEERRQELQQKYEEQVAKAREERSMALNPATGKIEKIIRKK